MSAYHLDRRADGLLEDTSMRPDDELIDTRQAAAEWKTSESIWRKWRMLGIGPTPTYITPACVRYSRGELRRFLKERADSRYASRTDVADAAE